MMVVKFSYSATIEVSLNGEILANTTLIDPHRNQTYITDSMGRIEKDGCMTLSYMGEDNITYRSMNLCLGSGLYRVTLKKEISVSGTIEVPEPCDCRLVYFNLEEGLEESDPVTRNFSTQLPVGKYRIKVITTRNNANPSSDGDFYINSVGVDASTQSVSDINIGTARADNITRWPDQPPRADLISVRHLETSHLSFVEGAPGAAEPLVRIGMLNMQTGQLTAGFSESDGSFSIKFFAPPGAALQINQDRHASSELYNSKRSSTVIHVPIPDPAFSISTGQKLSTGSVAFSAKGGGKGDPGVAWLTGTLDSTDWQAGQSGTLSGTVDIYSRNLDYGAVPDFERIEGNGIAMLELLFNERGEQKAAKPEFSASDLTVTGMPIEMAKVTDRRANESIIIGRFFFFDYELVGAGHGRASWSLDYTVPPNTPDGIYQLILTGKDDAQHPWIGGLTSDRIFYEDVFEAQRFHLTEVHGAARINIGQVQSPRLYSAILLNDVSNGSRGTISNTDIGKFGFSGHWVANAQKLILPPSTTPDGSVRKYNIEPFVPLTAFTSREWLNPPKVPLDFPTGQLSATIRSPSGTRVSVGPHSIKGASAQQATTEVGESLAPGENNLDSLYALTTYSDDFELVLDEYGEYQVTLEGSITDIYGESYEISGVYSIYIAELLDIETGVFPGTPFEVGDSYAPAVIIQPGVPAKVTVSLSHFPNSSESARVDKVFTGDANRFGYFSSNDEDFSFTAAGEYLANYDIEYTSPDGVLWMASRRWASVVETPDTNVITHGHRGSENAPDDFPTNRQWYLMKNGDLTKHTHFFSPYQIGDIMWMEDAGNETSSGAMQNIVTLDDGDGTLTELIANRDLINLDIGSMHLHSSSDTQVPPFVDPTQSDIHWAYYYSSIGRPGVSVREFVGTGVSPNAYWKFDTPYGYQLGSGYEGDQTNDFKFIFGGAVYRVPDSNFSHYGAYGALWTLLPDSDTDGGRVMPPFQGAAGGPSGGPLFELKGEEIDIFLHPQGVRPGSILEIGDVVSFSGQVAPTLPSKVQVEITAPSGAKRSFGGVANKIGYYFNPANDYVVAEAGIHTVNVTVFHDGATSAGQVDPPYPTGSILGTANGSFKFYVTSDGTMQASVASSMPAKLPKNARLTLQLQGSDGSSPNGVEYTAVMPGFILNQSTLSGASTIYDAYELHESFPNLDLPGGELQLRTGADTVTLSFLTQRPGSDGTPIYEGRQVLLQGEQILAPSHLKKLGGTFDIDLQDSTLTPGNRLTASVDFAAQGDADIYVAVSLPSGHFVTVDQNLNLSGVDEIIPFMDSISLDDRSSLPIVDVPLDDSIDPGDYRLIVLVTAAGTNVYDESYWLAFDEVNFTFTR